LNWSKSSFMRDSWWFYMMTLPTWVLKAVWMKPPQKLYKYCPVSENSLRSIIRAQVFHSPPMQFNDPLDCNPSLKIDLATAELEALLKKMMADVGASDDDVRKEIDRITYFATEPDDWDDVERGDKIFSYLLGEEIMRLLRKQLGTKGVLSLSAKWDEPLLWSHYAAQHKGICIEYETNFDLQYLKAIDYNAPRALSAHDVYLWKCAGDKVAAGRIFDTYFYAKAPQWSYEAEWRDINDKSGLNPLHFDITAIHFGMRVDPVWKLMLVKTLHRDQQVALYDMLTDENSFELHRRQIERDELERRGIDQPAFRVFGDYLTDIEPYSIGERAVEGQTDDPFKRSRKH